MMFPVRFAGWDVESGPCRPVAFVRLAGRAGEPFPGSAWAKPPRAERSDLEGAPRRESMNGDAAERRALPHRDVHLCQFLVEALRALLGERAVGAIRQWPGLGAQTNPFTRRGAARQPVLAHGEH